MNKLTTAFATMLLTTAVIAAPGGRGGNPGKGGGRPAAPARQVQHAPAAKPAQHAAARPAVHRPAAPRPGFGHRPAPCHHRHWARPAMPPIRPLARFGWTWVATPWTILVDGVTCTGDGYWFDGYNYYYNDRYFTAAPVSLNLNIRF